MTPDFDRLAASLTRHAQGLAHERAAERRGGDARLNAAGRNPRRLGPSFGDR